MPGALNQISALDIVAHVIQVALTPVFLLSGIATLLNVFSTRLGRVADRVDQITKAIEEADADENADLAVQLSHLRRRSLALDTAVVLGAVWAERPLAGRFSRFLSDHCVMRPWPRYCSRHSASPSPARLARSQPLPWKC